MNLRMDWVARVFKYHQVPILQPHAGLPATRSRTRCDCPGQSNLALNSSRDGASTTGDMGEIGNKTCNQ